MMIRLLTTLSTVLSLTAAATNLDAGASIPASSRLGSSLLSKARRLNNNNNNNNEADYTWVADYSIRFDSCHTTLEFRADAGADGEDETDGAPTESMRLVHFKLCPTDKCDKSCKNGADYLVEMREFVESYLEFQMTQQEYNCEQVEENCNCENANDDEVCLQQCYQDAGLDYCENDQNNNNGNNNNNNNGNDFELDRYLECEQLNENDGYSSPIYVGAYCSNNGKSILLGTFTDRQCTQHSDVETYKSYTGYDLPYTTTSIVKDDCISCMEPSEYDDDYNADQNDADAVVEICEELYERSAKCERNLQNVESKSVGGCDYIFKTLPQVERLTSGGASPAVVFAWMFAITSVLLACYAYYLYKRLTRNRVDLSTQGI